MGSKDAISGLASVKFLVLQFLVPFGECFVLWALVKKRPLRLCFAGVSRPRCIVVGDIYAVEGASNPCTGLIQEHSAVRDRPDR